MRPIELIPPTSPTSPTAPAHTTLSYPIILSKASTASFHKACKKHKSNITPVINAILVLADVETTLWWGLRSGGQEEKFGVVKEMFESSEYFPIPINGMDRVRYLFFFFFFG